MKHRVYSWFLCLLDILIVGFSFVWIAWQRSGTRVILREYSRPLFGFMVIWITVSLLGNKYDLKPPKSVMKIITRIVSNNIMSLGIVFLLTFFFQLFTYSRFIVFGTILATSVLEIIIFILIFFTFRLHRESDIVGKPIFVTQSVKLDEVAGKFFNSNDGAPAEEIPYSPDFGSIDLAESVIVKLWQKYLGDQSALFNYINDMLDLNRFSEKKTMILRSSTFFNIEHLDSESQQFFMNLHPINDIRRLNRYFIKVNQNLVPGGVFVCCGETITQRYHRFLRNSGKVFGNVFYLFDFLFRRVSPKVLLTQGMYFALTKGRNRSLSETEILGRLYFCGFKVLGYKEIEGMMYFIVRKIKEHSEDLNPSYGLLIKLKRVGLNGRIFNCYKLRTMHPYSEYLQEYVHSIHSVSSSGKFANDFRVTNWGKVLRKFWIDEIPQFINLFKGDVRLIGTRALSSHYLSQYPDDVREMRVKTKPGLIPVYTADKVTNLIDLIQSERKYLELRSKRPFITDARYLTKALFNILTRRVKSLDCYN